MAHPLLMTGPMHRVSIVSACALGAALLSATAAAEMRPVELSDLVSLARLSFRVERGDCRAEPGPDGMSVRVSCPPTKEDLARVTRDALSKSPVRVFLEQHRDKAVLEIVVPTALGGYHITQKKRHVTIDVGQRAQPTELPRILKELRWPLAEPEDDDPTIARLDRLFAKGDLDGVGKILKGGVGMANTELFGLRRGDFACIKGDLAGAREAYASVTTSFPSRPGGLLSAARFAQLEALRRSGRLPAGMFEPASTTVAPKRATVLSWLTGARIAFWQKEWAEVIRLTDAVKGAEPTKELSRTATTLQNQALAALVLQAARLTDHESVGTSVLTYRKKLVVHPALNLLAPPAYKSLMKLSLPRPAASVIQALVAASDSDIVVVQAAPLLSEAYLQAGQTYRASQVVSFALAVSRRNNQDRGRLWTTRSRIAVIEGEGLKALSYLDKSPEADAIYRLRAAVSAMHGGGSKRAAATLDAMVSAGKVPRSLRRQVELARAEAHGIERTDEAPELLRVALLGTAPSPRMARLQFLRARTLEASGNLTEAEAAYRATKGDPRWESLAKTAIEQIEMEAFLRAKTDEEPSSSKEKRPRRRPRRRGKKATGKVAQAKASPPVTGES